MKYEPSFTWDETNGIAQCTISNGTNKYVGTSKCHPDDQDMLSEKVGCFIALKRAEIKYLKGMRVNEILPGLRALQQLYYSMNCSKRFNPNSYENSMLWRQIRNKENDLVAVDELIATAQQELKSHIENSELLYSKVRRIRKARQSSKVNKSEKAGRSSKVNKSEKAGRYSKVQKAKSSQ